MEETELQAILKREISAATGYMADEVATDRSRLMDRYLGEPLGNEIEGRSTIQATDVMDVIESIMPDLMQIFTAGAQAVKFEPQGPEDEEAAGQANDLLNHVFYVQNNGFLLLYDLIKDALVQINGFAKIWVDKSEEWKRETFTGLTEDEMAQILADDDVEAIEHTEREAEDAGAIAPVMPPTAPMQGTMPPEMQGAAMGVPPGMPQMGAGLPSLAPPPTVHDLVIKRLDDRTRFRIEAFPPEEMLFPRNARTLDDAVLLAHRRERTVSDLIEEGYDDEELRQIPSGSELSFSTETISRDHRQTTFPSSTDADEPSRKILIHEAYLKVDWNGDGITEWRKVTAAGPGLKILDNEEADGHPFVTITPLRMPHRVLGIALAELAEDIQLLKTSLWRATLDNFYFINNGRMAISNKVSLEDVLSNRVGSPIRVDVNDSSVGGHFVPIAPNPIGAITQPLIEYADQVRETRTGVTRYGQGLDAESLNKTASGINMILGRSQQRVLLIARLFAETGIKDLFRKLLRLVINHSDKEQVIRLRGKWVQIDPRSWNAEMDMTVNVGLGHGTQEQRAQMTQLLLQVQEKIIMFQGGVQGPLVGLEEIRNTLEQFSSAIGFKSADPYFKQVDGNTQLPPPKPDPAMQKAQAEMQIKQMEMQQNGQMAQAEMQMKAQAMQQENALAEKKMMLEHTLELQRMGTENAHEKARLHMEAANMMAELQMKRMEMNAEINLDRRKAEMDAAIKRETAKRATQTQRNVQ